nr:fucose isomerase [Ardenticatenia bacterium]
KAVIFHCSNLPADLFVDTPEMGHNAILAQSLGQDMTHGTVVGRLKAQPITFCRVSTDDLTGTIAAYIGEGAITDDPLQTFGGYGVVQVPGFQDLLQFICEYGFEHHTAINASLVADSVDEAFGKYLDWDVYYHV